MRSGKRFSCYFALCYQYGQEDYSFWGIILLPVRNWGDAISVVVIHKAMTLQSGSSTTLSNPISICPWSVWLVMIGTNFRFLYAKYISVPMQIAK